jgi:hypothetical protein
LTARATSTTAGSADGEGDDCDNEEGGDGEPSLGSTATINQEASSFGGTYDREQGTTGRFREEPKVPSICNVTLLDGSKLVVE